MWFFFTMWYSCLVLSLQLFLSYSLWYTTTWGWLNLVSPTCDIRQPFNFTWVMPFPTMTLTFFALSSDSRLSSSSSSFISSHPLWIWALCKGLWFQAFLCLSSFVPLLNLRAWKCYQNQKSSLCTPISSLASTPLHFPVVLFLIV